MKFTQHTLGTLVRPRILAKAVVFPLSLPEEEHDVFWTNLLAVKRPTINERLSIYNKSLQNLFSDISLGDTTSDSNKLLRECYVGVVTHYLVKIGTTFYVINQNNFKTITNKIKYIYGNRTTVKICKVGLSFFKGVKKNLTTGDYEPTEPWEATKNYAWFFDKLDLVDFKSIVEFEGAEPGNLVIYKRAKSFVLTKKKLNKPKFYLTSSWSCMAFKLLCGTKLKVRFLPNRPFRLLKKK